MSTAREGGRESEYYMDQLQVGLVEGPRFRGELVFKAHRLCVSLNSRPESNKEEEKLQVGRGWGRRFSVQVLGFIVGFSVQV